MKPEADWQSEFEHEIAHALSARDSGMEGMARVCARRAAGIVIGAYLICRGYVNLNESAFDRLTLFISLPDVDDQLKKVSHDFLIKVSRDHTLPVNVDLISKAQWLANVLLLENND